MIELLKNPLVWDVYYKYKLEKGHLSEEDQEELEAFIKAEAYLPIVEKILQGEGFSVPRKVIISKMYSQKKRIVYTYDKAENYVLKVLTFLLQRKYDTVFADNLYSFRPDHGVKQAIYKLTHTPDISEKWSYKVDISNYFNSVPVEKMLECLRTILEGEEAVLTFVSKLLCNPLVNDHGKIIEEEKGIMAGTPISTFLANVYLAHMDHYFAKAGKLYARYSDDIIIFEDSEGVLKASVEKIHMLLREAGLSINPKKECYTKPKESWTFLGIGYENGVVDVAPVSVEKMKAKMRRKTKALMRWKARTGALGVQAAKAFVRVFNNKLYSNDEEHELTWVRWYFPLINTVKSLKVIDEYSQSCIRYLATGKHTKAAYNFRYEDMKEIGYISLVNRYYNHHK